MRLANENPAAASRVLDALESCFGQLAANRGLGHRRADLTRGELRFWGVYDWLVVYDPRPSPLVIVRVLHGRRDVRSELDSPRPQSDDPQELDD